MAIASMLFSKVAGHLSQRFIGCYAHTDRHTHASHNSSIQTFAPFFQVDLFHPIETFINAIPKIGWRFLLDNLNHTPRKFAIEFVVRRENSDIVMRKQFGQLIVRRAILDSHKLGFVRTRHHTPIVVA